MFSDHLKRSTATAHLELERKMIPHLKKISSEKHYIRLLGYLHHYYEKLEQQLKPWMPDTNQTSDAMRIRDDIKALDPAYEINNRTDVEVPRIDSKERALGVSYVLEGSTLGGQIITGMLSKQIGGNTTKGFTFYNPYGAATGEQWNIFKQRLEAPLTEAQREQVIAAANETFETLNRWISDYGAIEA